MIFVINRIFFFCLEEHCIAGNQATPPVQGVIKRNVFAAVINEIVINVKRNNRLRKVKNLISEWIDILEWWKDYDWNLKKLDSIKGFYLNEIIISYGIYI